MPSLVETPRPPAGLYPFTSRSFERNGLRLHYLDEGQGEPIVMLHGNPTWSFYYRNLVVALRDQYLCIVPDHLGCGLSEKPQPPRYDYSLQSRIADLTALLEHLKITEKITLVVHDWGGMIGLNWAVHHAEQIRRLVILNTAAFPLPQTKRLPWRLWLGRNTRLGAWLIKSENLFCVHAADIGTKRKPLPLDVREWYLKPYDNSDNRIAILKFVQTIPLKPEDSGYDIIRETGDGLAKFKETPTLICWGMQDFVFDAAFLAEWEKRLPHAKVHRFADCGHYILEDAPGEIISLVREFLTT